MASSGYIVSIMGKQYYMRGEMVESFRLYLTEGIVPGGFGLAVLEHDLVEAVNRADAGNIDNLPAFVHFMNWQMPAASHGSPEKVRRWMGDECAHLRAALRSDWSVKGGYPGGEPWRE